MSRTIAEMPTPMEKALEPYHALREALEPFTALARILEASLERIGKDPRGADESILKALKTLYDEHGQVDPNKWSKLEHRIERLLHILDK